MLLSIKPDKESIVIIIKQPSIPYKVRDSLRPLCTHNFLSTELLLHSPNVKHESSIFQLPASLFLKEILMRTFSLEKWFGLLVNVHSRPHRPRSFWSAPRTATSGRVRFSEHAQRIRFVLSANQICQTRL